jgi:glycosyltransferase involved in cell wall biosynthesis
MGRFPERKRDDNMKIAFFYRELDQGGIQRMLIDCTNYFAQNGYDVSFVLMKRSDDYHQLLNEKIKVIYFDSIKKTQLYRSFANILKREKFDVLYSATPALNIFSIVTRMLCGSKTKLIISEHNNTLVFFRNMKFTLSKLTYLSIPLLYRYADGIIAVSKGVGEGLQKIALLPDDKITVIHNPAYSPIIQEQLKEHPNHEWFNDGEIPTFITVGRLTEAKNHALLLDAMKLVVKNRPAKLLIIGEGHLRPQLEEKIKELELSDCVSLVGFVVNPVSWISQSNVFVLSSDYEGFGIVLVEALAAGTTIVSTDCDYGPEEILDNRYGYLVPVRNAMELAKKMEFALDHPLEKALLRRRAQEFSVDNIMSEYAHMFEAVGRSSEVKHEDLPEF